MARVPREDLQDRAEIRDSGEVTWTRPNEFKVRCTRTDVETTHSHSKRRREEEEEEDTSSSNSSGERRRGNGRFRRAKSTEHHHSHSDDSHGHGHNSEHEGHFHFYYTCEFIFGSWNYHANEIDVQMLFGGLDMSRFRDDDLYHVYDVNSERRVTADNPPRIEIVYTFKIYPLEH